jgi:hypothetical protein
VVTGDVGIDRGLGNSESLQIVGTGVDIDGTGH